MAHDLDIAASTIVLPPPPPSAMPAAELARALSLRYADAGAEEVIRAGMARFREEGLALVSSFGADSAVLLHMIARIDPAFPVILVDTGKLFGETLRYRDMLVARLGLTNLRSIRPVKNRLDAVDPDGTLWFRDPDACCAVRKVEPLADAMREFGVWITGRKRYQAETRANLPVFEADGDTIKINPLAGWSSRDVEAYRIAYDLPAHPLVADGYRSIGCMPCTDRVAEGEDDRAGRWRGQAKTECGIHLGLGGGASSLRERPMTLVPSLAPQTPAAEADVFRDGRFEADDWIRLADDAPVPPEGHALVSLARLKAESVEAGLGNAPIGVVVAPADRVADLVPFLDRLSVIAVDFPKFNDGRGFSHAAQIARLGFKGELRAVGNVLIDQIALMRRLGFTAFSVSHGPTRRYLAENRDPAPKLHYQPAVRSEPPVGTRPWLRRSG